MIIYSDPIYKGEARRALRKEGRIASNQLALDSLLGFMHNVRAGRERRDAEASQAEAAAYYGRALQSPGDIPQLTGELVAKAQRYGGAGATDPGAGSWLFGKLVGGNKGITGADALSVMQGMRGISSDAASAEASRASSQIELAKLGISERNTSVAEAEHERNVASDQFQRQQYADSAGDRWTDRLGKALKYWDDWSSSRRTAEKDSAEEARKAEAHQFDMNYAKPAAVELDRARAYDAIRGSSRSAADEDPELTALESWTKAAGIVHKNESALRDLATDVSQLGGLINDPSGKWDVTKLMLYSDPAMRARLDAVGQLPDVEQRKAQLIQIREALVGRQSELEKDAAKSRELAIGYADEALAHRKSRMGRGPPRPPELGGDFDLAPTPGTSASPRGAPSPAAPAKAPGAAGQTKLQALSANPTPSAIADLWDSFEPGSAQEKLLLKAMEEAGVDMSTFEVSPEQAAKIARRLGGSRKP